MFKPLTAALGALALLVGATFLSAQTAPATSRSPATSAATPAAAKPLSDLKISLMDGSILNGKLSVSELAIDTKFGPLKVPVDQIMAFVPGLQSHPKFQQTIDGYINDLSADAFAERERAQQALNKLGPDIRGELERQLKGAENEKAMRLQKIIEDFDASQDEDADKSRLWVKDDVIVTAGFTVVGRITTPGFSIAGNYGTLQIRMEDVREGRREGGEPEEIRKNITVTGTAISQRLFTNTQIKLAKGDQVIITATGSINMPPWGNNQQSTPEGASNFGTVQPGIFTGTLVGRVGDSTPIFKVGSKLTWTADRAGVFQLGIATQGDYQGYTFAGEYQVKIRVIKKQ